MWIVYRGSSGGHTPPGERLTARKTNDGGKTPEKLNHAVSRVGKKFVGLTHGQAKRVADFGGERKKGSD